MSRHHCRPRRHPHIDGHDPAPDYFVRRSESWLVFPHEIQGLARVEILTHEPPDPSSFDVRGCAAMLPLARALGTCRGSDG